VRWATRRLFDGETLSKLGGPIPSATVRYSNPGISCSTPQQIRIDCAHARLRCATTEHRERARAARLSRQQGSTLHRTATPRCRHLYARSKHARRRAIVASVSGRSRPFSLVMLTGQAVCFSQPHGFHPLALRRRDDAYVVFSEPSRWDPDRGDLRRERQPGEIVASPQTASVRIKPFRLRRWRTCISSTVFARPDSYGSPQA